MGRLKTFIFGGDKLAKLEEREALVYSDNIQMLNFVMFEGEENPTPKEKFDGSFAFLSVIVVILFLLFLLMLLKRRKRIKEDAAFERGHNAIINKTAHMI